MNQRLFGLTTIQERLAQVGLGRSECRLQFDGETKMFERFLPLAQLAEGDSKVIVSHRKVCTELECAAKVFDGLRMLTESLQGGSQITERSGYSGRIAKAARLQSAARLKSPTPDKPRPGSHCTLRRLAVKPRLVQCVAQLAIVPLVDGRAHRGNDALRRSPVLVI